MNNYLRQIVLRALPGAACVRPRVLSLFEPQSPNPDWKRALDFDSEILSDAPQVARDGGEVVTGRPAPSGVAFPPQLSQKPSLETLLPEGLPKAKQLWQPTPQSRASTDASSLEEDLIKQDLPKESSKAGASQPQRAGQREDMPL